MSYRDLNPPAPRRITSLSLDYGVDGHDCLENPIEFSEHGMHLRSRWQFSIGTRLAISFTGSVGSERSYRLAAEGIVVWCEPCNASPGTFVSTLLFLELPDELKARLRELSSLLGVQG